MRHAYFGRRLSRDTNARKALAANLATSLFERGKITTTLAKAKFARPYVEKLITGAKRQKDLKTRRALATSVASLAFTKLHTTLGVGFAARPGGYTRIVRLNPRRGDAAPLARLELLPIEKQQTAQSAQKKTDNTPSKSEAPEPASEKNENHKTS